MATSAKKQGAVRTRRAITHLLKQEGPMEAAMMAERLQVSAMAIRQHLYALQDEHLVTYQEAPRPMGRPAKVWQLTSAADHLFPEGYAELTVGLLKAMQDVFGEAGLEQLLAARTIQQIETYTAQLSTKPPTDCAARLAALAKLRTEEGYMAEVRSLEDGTFLLIENHCPICAAATACTGLCDSELEVFQAVLGTDLHVERTEHIIEGERRCVYQVTPADGSI